MSDVKITNFAHNLDQGNDQNPIISQLVWRFIFVESMLPPVNSTVTEIPNVAKHDTLLPHGSASK